MRVTWGAAPFRVAAFAVGAAVIAALALLILLGSASAASDVDGDGVDDSADNCPAWANPDQLLPSWSIPASDSDCDGYPDGMTAMSRAPEFYMGTLVMEHCSATSASNDEETDAWPMDFDDDQWATGSDILTFAPAFGKVWPDSAYDPRHDLNGDAKVTGRDLLRFGIFFGKSCAPPATPTPIPTDTPVPTPAPTPTPTATPVCDALPSIEATPIAGGPIANSYAMTKLSSDAAINKLANIAPIPGSPGRALIANEPGEFYSICLTSNQSRELVADMTSIVKDLNEGHDADEGVSGIAFDPLDPNVIYIDYTTPPDGHYLNGAPDATTISSRISRFQIVDGQIDLGSEEIILDIYQPGEWHNGNALVFGPDGMLYIGSGDGGPDASKGQTLNDLWGAILRIDVHGDAPYEIPADNPFVDGPGGNADEVWAYGLRNPWRFTFDGDEMWLTDVGEGAFEEVNIGAAGANYGWNTVEGLQCSPASLPTPTPVQTCDTTGFTPPRAVYTHNFSTGGCAIISGHVYRGTAMPELDGFFIYNDYCTGRIWALDTDDSGASPILLVDTGNRLTSWAVTSNGELIAVNHSVSGGGGVYLLQRAP